EAGEGVALPRGGGGVSAEGMDRPLRVGVPLGGHRGRVLRGPPPPLAARRGPACGPVCTGRRACTLLEMRRAELLASPGPPGEPDGPAWLRLWAETLVLAFLTNHGRPAVPDPLRRWWPTLDRRLRERLLATVVDRAVRARALAVRTCYDPAALAVAAAGAGRHMLDQGAGAGGLPGPDWVIPQVRWLREMEMVCPLGGPAPDPADRAPAPGFDLPGLAGWPGMRGGHRLGAARPHPLATRPPGSRALRLATL